MAKSLLGIIQQVSGELSQPIPTTVLSSTDSTTQQMKYLAVAACEELCEMHDWQRLIKKYTISTAADVLKYDLPADCLRVISQSGFNSTNSTGMDGSTTSSTWARINSNNAFDNYRFRILGNQVVFAQSPGATPQTITFEYVSSNYVYDAGLKIQKPEFESDSDQPIFPQRLLTLFIKLKYWENMGQDTNAIAQAFNVSLQNAKSTDTPAPKIYLTGSAYRFDNTRLIGEIQ